MIMLLFLFSRPLPYLTPSHKTQDKFAIRQATHPPHTIQDSTPFSGTPLVSLFLPFLFTNTTHQHNSILSQGLYFFLKPQENRRCTQEPFSSSHMSQQKPILSISTKLVFSFSDLVNLHPTEDVVERTHVGWVQLLKPIFCHHDARSPCFGPSDVQVEQEHPHCLCPLLFSANF